MTKANLRKGFSRSKTSQPQRRAGYNLCTCPVGRSCIDLHCSLSLVDLALSLRMSVQICTLICANENNEGLFKSIGICQVACAAAHPNISTHLQLAVPPALAWTLHFCHKPSQDRLPTRTSLLKSAKTDLHVETSINCFCMFLSFQRKTSAANRVTSFRVDVCGPAGRTLSSG